MHNLGDEKDPINTLVHFISEEENFSYFLKGPIPGLCIYLNPLVPAIVPTPCLAGLAVSGHETNRMRSLVTEGPKGASGGSTFPLSTGNQLPYPSNTSGLAAVSLPPARIGSPSVSRLLSNS